MKQVNLPLVAMSTGLSKALTKLRKSKRSALFAESGGEYHLFTAGNIASGRSKGVEKLSELTSTAKLKPSGKQEKTSKHAAPRANKAPGARKHAAARPDLAHTYAPAGGGRVAAGFALQSITGESVMLGIRSIKLAVNFISSPKDLYCDGPRHHDDFPPPEVSEGDPCPHRDGHKIVSAK
jgi:hypothetical protein